MKKDWLIKILFIVAFIGSVYLIISGLSDSNNPGSGTEEKIIYETGISLSEVSFDLNINESKKVEASVIPSNATYKTLTWTSLTPNIVTVDDGLITAISSGTGIVKVETEQKKIARTITVNVKPVVINIEKIIVENPNIEIYIGETAKINYRIEPENATNKKISFKVNSTDIAGFNTNKEIIGINEGTTTITISSDNGITETVTVKVNKKDVDVAKIELSKNSLVLKKGETKKITAKVSPSNATNKTVTWSSSNKNVATVNDGEIKAVGYGDAIITAKGSNGVEATCNVVIANEYDVENKAVREYFSDANRNIKSHFNNNNCKQSGICDKPNLYTSKIKGNIKVYLYNVSTGKKNHIKTVSDAISLSNVLVPGNTYYLESSDGKTHEYVTVKKGLRMMYTQHVTNVRDLGGWKADGGSVKYGLIFRGANPYGNPTATEATFKLMGITDIVDLRTNSEFNSAKKAMPSFSKYLFVVGGYSPNNNENRKAVEKIMQLVVADKKVFFHCAVGTDRTGTIAMFLEGILGVSNGNIHDDYELSYFRRQVSNSGKTRTNGSFVSLFNSVQKHSGNGQEKFINWFLSKSSDKNRDLKLINDFRKKMIDGNPTTYKLSNGTLVKG